MPSTFCIVRYLVSQSLDVAIFVVLQLNCYWVTLLSFLEYVFKSRFAFIFKMFFNDYHISLKHTPKIKTNTTNTCSHMCFCLYCRCFENFVKIYASTPPSTWFSYSTDFYLKRFFQPKNVLYFLETKTIVQKKTIQNCCKKLRLFQISSWYIIMLHQIVEN